MSVHFTRESPDAPLPEAESFECARGVAWRTLRARLRSRARSLGLMEVGDSEWTLYARNADTGELLAALGYD